MKKKIFCMSLAIALIAGQVYAVDFSIGISAPGYGIGVLRGENAEKMLDTVKDLDFTEDSKLSFFPAIQVNFLLGFSPYLALETGIGYGKSMFSWSKDESLGTATIDLKREGIIIPVMIRSQFALGIFNFYVAMGPKFVIPVGKEYFTATVKAGNIVTTTHPYEENPFTIDLGFALGGEIKMGSLYIGVRAGYDLNLLSPIKEARDSDDEIKWYHDVFNASITLRYAL